ncbi:MAG: hypothetical protein EPN93_20115 [Spirochaetes bacterium]|nr:MAG: hypothetical protein EPN93_20115 [Spirochaetota bacterium]
MAGILILGNGGAVNDGLPYNAFLVDGTALVEAPPDVMLSLHREGIAPPAIEDIYISHLHGDHCFGFPFLALGLFFQSVRDGDTRRRSVFVPGGGRDYLLALTEMALGTAHPCIDWIRARIMWTDISVTNPILLAGRETRLYRMEHFVEAYGFTMHEGASCPLAYSADTLWCESMERIIACGPEIFIVDLNGEPGDPVAVHLSEAELVEKGVPLARAGTRFHGTHLKRNKSSAHPALSYVRAGQSIVT